MSTRSAEWHIQLLRRFRRRPFACIWLVDIMRLDGVIFSHKLMFKHRPNYVLKLLLVSYFTILGKCERKVATLRNHLNVKTNNKKHRISSHTCTRTCNVSITSSENYQLAKFENPRLRITRATVFSWNWPFFDRRVKKALPYCVPTHHASSFRSLFWLYQLTFIRRAWRRY